ncbi:enoyl-CoA hydratase/isomerase family protein [Pseudomonas putida]|uniref:enoyl-CoA hydratase/isomerase family protein n=1 Tax=Pseudomonas sp. YNh TaxID=3133145 RepID=UPI000D4F4340|nr:enoyl-CoA hydratase/isomerase family protein [Pseudomonas putida]PTC01826.1 enoyl-CoA hydratase [Thalassospira xiamenensis]
MSGHVDLSREGFVARLTLDSPGKYNAVSQSMWIQIGDIVEELSTDDRIRCIVFSGAGDKAFSSGGDIDEFESIRGTKEKAEAYGRHCHRAMRLVQHSPIPTLAAIRGICMGGGLELAAHCDLRVASDNSRFAIPIARLGAVLAYPEMEGLVRLVGGPTALELLLESRTFYAQEAREKGLVQRVVAADEFNDEIEKTIERIVENAPLSARTHKRFIERLRAKHEPLNTDELAEGYACFDTEDYKTGYRSFLAKSRPVFQGK